MPGIHCQAATTGERPAPPGGTAQHASLLLDQREPGNRVGYMQDMQTNIDAMCQRHNRDSSGQSFNLASYQSVREPEQQVEEMVFVTKKPGSAVGQRGGGSTAATQVTHDRLRQEET